MPKRRVRRSYEPDDGPLTPEYIAALRIEAAKYLPTGKVLFRSDLLPDLEKMAVSLWESSPVEDALFKGMREKHSRTTAQKS